MEVISLGTDSSFCMDRISMFSFSSPVIFSIFLGISIFVGFGKGLVGFEKLLTLLRVSILAIRIVIMSFKAQRSGRRWQRIYPPCCSRQVSLSVASGINTSLLSK